MENSVQMMAQAARKAARQLAAVSLDTRNAALLAIADGIAQNKAELIEVNALDVAQATEENLSAPLLSRLKLSDQKCERMIEGLRALALLPDPLGHVQYAKELSPGLNLYRVACPIGVVGVIFESRPDALVQISSLCLKSGNAVLLKGGREALRTNAVLTRIICEATEKAGIPAGWCALLQSREDVSEMLKLHELIDLIIPRGSNAFVHYIMQNSEIPVLGHAEGLCHVYVDADCDLNEAVKVAVDSKTQNLSVCNAAETLLVHRAVAEQFLPVAAKALIEKGTELRGDEAVGKIIACLPADETDWETEYLDSILSIRIVDGLDEAIEHINHYGSHHTDAILTTNAANAERFMTMVDSADVFWNCSTRFSDGFLFGFGAEVGIATGKIHARGPMGMEGLCTYKYRLYGHGQTLTELNRGEISLTHRDLPKELPC
ncbi:MAG: glutamate-5-semialdehyde dehydrogenase [Clostridiales bacterium]|nr:glutamate-5-semialdehyde dehydrogenase [Clostridiales bacterium]